MCLVLVTTSWLVWAVSSVAAAALLLAGHLSPHWLLGHAVVLQHTAPPLLDEDLYDAMVWRGAVSVRPSLGLWLRCTIMAGKKGVAASQHCGMYATAGADLPTAQVVAMAALVTGAGVALIAVLLVLLSACCREVANRSIFNIVGSLQALAGLFCVSGLCVYPLSWSSVRVLLMCGPNVGEFLSGTCSLGWALYATIAGTALLLVCAVGAVHVDNTVSSNRAEEEIRRGNHVVCIL